MNRLLPRSSCWGRQAEARWIHSSPVEQKTSGHTGSMLAQKPAMGSGHDDVRASPLQHSPRVNRSTSPDWRSFDDKDWRVLATSWKAKPKTDALCPLSLLLFVRCQTAESVNPLSLRSPLSLSSHPTTPSVFTLPFSLLSLSLSLVWTRRRPRSISPYRYGRGFFEHRERRAVGRFSLKIDLRCSSTAWISLSSSSLLLPGLCCYRSLWFLQFLTRFSTGLWNSGEAHNAVIVPWTLMQCCGA